jgi:hypothetical protein
LLPRQPRGSADAGTTALPIPSTVLILILLVFLSVAFVGPWGCASGQTRGGESGAFPPQTLGDLTVTLRVSPYPPAPMQQAEFSISIVDGQGRPVAGARVSCDMSMPAMAMPPNRPLAVEQSPGLYTTPVMFTMAGDWEALIEVLPTDAASGEFRFSMKTR